MGQTRQQKRDELVAVLGQVVLGAGLADASLKRLAEAADTSDRMLLYYFDDKSDLMTATLDHLTAQMSAALKRQRLAEPAPREALRDHLIGVMLGDEFQPYIRLWLDIAARSARGVAPYSDVAARMAEGFRDWIAGQLAISEPARLAKVSMQLLSTIEGVVLLNATGLGTEARDAVIGRG